MTEQPGYAVEQPVAPAPAPRVNLDLDSLERPPSEANREPYSFALAGRVITLLDPQELEWDLVLNAANDPAALLYNAMSRKDRRFVSEKGVPLWKMTKAVEGYMAYYDLEDAEGNDA